LIDRESNIDAALSLYRAIVLKMPTPLEYSTTFERGNWCMWSAVGDGSIGDAEAGTVDTNSNPGRRISMASVFIYPPSIH
jgi:hypothetical protein